MALPEYAKQSVKQGGVFLLSENRTIVVQKVRAGNKQHGEAAQMVEYTINDENQAPRAVYEFKKWVWEQKSEQTPPEPNTPIVVVDQQQQQVEPIVITPTSQDTPPPQTPPLSESWWSKPNWMDDVFDFFFK